MPEDGFAILTQIAYRVYDDAARVASINKAAEQEATVAVRIAGGHFRVQTQQPGRGFDHV